MDRHKKETSSVRNVLGAIGENTPRYNPNRLYDDKVTRKKTSKKKSAASTAQKRLSFTVTYFEYPGRTIFKKLDDYIMETELKKICTGTIQLFLNMDSVEVSSKIFGYLKQDKNLQINENDLNFTYIKREGRERKIKRVSTDPDFTFDALAFKELCSGSPNKNILVLLGSPLPCQQKKSATLSISQGNSTFIDTQTYSSDDDSLSPAPTSTPLMPLKRKKTVSNVSNTSRKQPKRDVLVVSTSSSETDEELDFNDLEEISKNVYATISDNGALLAVLTVMRHLTSFMHCLNLSIEQNGDNASKLELSLAQVMILFGDDALKSCWSIALAELANMLHIHSISSVGDAFKALLNALRDLKSEIWLDFFLVPEVSSELITEYRGENGFEHIVEQDIETLKFNALSEVNIRDLLNTFIERSECTFPYEDEKYCIQKGENVYARKFFQRLPQLLFLELENSKKLAFAEEIKKINLYDTKAYNKEVLSIAAVVAMNEDKYYVAFRHQKNKFVQVYANGSVYTAEVSLKDFITKKLPLCQKVFVMYADSKVDGDGVNAVDALKDEPSIDSIEVFGQFLFKRLSTKQAIESSEASQASSNDKRLIKESEKVFAKLEAKLALIEGQNELKAEIYRWAHHTMVQDVKRKNNIGSFTHAEMVSSLHMILSGNPGTGKTMIARCLAVILYEIGIIESPEIVEVHKDSIVSAYVSDTPKRCREVIESAFGRVMFIDEAYELCPQGNEKTHAREAVDTIMKYMNPSKNPDEKYPIFIFAGYPDDMDKFMEVFNRGMRRRLKMRFEFKDYTPEELSRITLSKMLQQKLNIPYGVEKILTTGFMLVPPSKRSDQNASLCEDLHQFIVQNQEARLNVDSTLEELNSYRKEDFTEGVKALVNKFVVDEKHQKSQEVWLHIPGVGLIPGSPRTPSKF